MSNDANWANVPADQQVNTSESDMETECALNDKDFYRKDRVGVDIGGYIFSNGAKFKVESDEA